MKPFYKYSFLLLLITATCIQPFEIDIETGDEILVISGMISNEGGPFKVQISYSRGFGETSDHVVTDAVVWVEDQAGNQYHYSGGAGGSYQAPMDFCGTSGNTYQLFVEINGEMYHSKPSLLKNPVPIDSIHWKYKKVINSDVNEINAGAQFFVDSHDDTRENNFFRYEWEGTHQIQVPFAATHVVIDSQIVEIDHVPSPCYSTARSNEIIIASTQGLGSNRIADAPVVFIPEYSAKLRHAYSLLVRQYSLTDGAYNYYKHLKRNNESGGSLFDQQQGTVLGNIESASGDEMVLGYFEVSGVSELRRKFTRTKDFYSQLALPPFPYNCGPAFLCDSDGCVDTLQVGPAKAIQLIEEVFGEQGAQIYLYEPMSMPPMAYIKLIGCTDCSYYASTIKPDFW